MDSVLNHLPTFEDGDDEGSLGLPTNRTHVTIGDRTPRGWPLIVQGVPRYLIPTKAAAEELAGLLNTLANFLAHGLTTHGGLAFSIGCDSAFELEQALRAVGITLTKQDAARD